MQTGVSQGFAPLLSESQLPLANVIVSYYITEHFTLRLWPYLYS